MNGALLGSYGTLQVASGVTLTLRGTGTITRIGSCSSTDTAFLQPVPRSSVKLSATPDRWILDLGRAEVIGLVGLVDHVAVAFFAPICKCRRRERGRTPELA